MHTSQVTTNENMALRSDKQFRWYPQHTLAGDSDDTQSDAFENIGAIEPQPATKTHIKISAKKIIFLFISIYNLKSVQLRSFYSRVMPFILIVKIIRQQQAYISSVIIIISRLTNPTTISNGGIPVGTKKIVGRQLHKPTSFKGFAK